MRPCTSTFPIDSSRNIRFRCTDASASVQGDVYLAEDTKLGRKIALKVLPPAFAESEERRVRFVREAKAASAIDHPNVAHIHEIGEADGVHFIAMQFVAGENLAARVKDDTLSIADIISIGLQVADALDAAHAKGIVHRDIKPANWCSPTAIKSRFSTSVSISVNPLD